MGEQAYIGGGLAWARPEQSAQFLACRRAAKSLAPSIAAAEIACNVLLYGLNTLQKGSRSLDMCSFAASCPLSCRQHCSCRIKAL